MEEEYSLDEVAAEYASTLKDLVCNSKPLISTLTMLADDYQAHARTIVGVIERHIIEAPSESKLPGLYLIDSICKNIGGVYITTFSTNIVSLFSGVFEKVDEMTRSQMYKLRTTWVDIFSNVKLHMIDRRVHGIDPAWPVADASGTRAVAASSAPASHSVSRTVHVNPNVIKVQEPSDVNLAGIAARPAVPTVRTQPDLANTDMDEIRIRARLLEKKKELFELQSQKLGLELAAVLKKFDEYTKSYLAANPHASLESDSRYQVEKINMKIKEGSIRVQQMEIAKQLDEVTAEILSLNPVSVSEPMRLPVTVAQLQPPVATVPVAPAPVQPQQQPRVMTVTPMPKVEKVQKQPSITPATTEKGSRDPRRNRATVPPQLEPEVPPATVSKPSVSSSPVKTSVVSDVSSKDPRLRRAGSKVKDAIKPEDIPLPDESPKLSQRTKSPVRSTPPKVKIESPARSVIELSPVRSKSKSRSSPSLRESPSRSPPRKQKRKGDRKEREVEERDKKVKVGVSSEVRRKEINGEEEKASKGKFETKLAEIVRPAASASESHRDVDLRTRPVIPSIISLPKPVSPIQEERDTGLFGTQDTDLRVLPSLVGRLAAAIRQKDGLSKEAAAEEAVVPPDSGSEILDIPIPPPPILPKKVEEKIEVPPPPKLPKIPRKPKVEPKEIEVEEIKKTKDHEERRKKRDEKGRRSPKRKREKSPTSSRSPPRKRERERSPISVPAGRSPLLEWDNRSRSPVPRTHTSDSPTRRRGWKDIKEKDDEKRGHDFDRRREPAGERGRERDLIPERGPGREREPIPERGIIREREPIGGLLGRPDRVSTLRPPFRGQDRPRGRGGLLDRGGRRFREDDDSADFIIEQAEQQLRNGIISNRQFTDIVNDVLRRRESRMLREAQRRDGFLVPMPHPLGPRGPHPRLPRHMGPLPHMDPRPLLDLRPPVPPGFVPRGLLLESQMPMEETLEQNVINIDGIPREVRFYGEKAIALMAPNEPRELSFYPEDIPRAVRVDGQIVGQVIVGEDYKELFFGNRPHMIRIGAPTRELYIDGKGHEFMFHGPDVPVTIEGRVCLIGVSGPRPSVSIGEDLRTDLIAGKTEMILNGEKIIPVYLDSLEQRFEVRGKIHTLRFEDALQTVFFDGIPYRPNFGGLPVRIELGGEPHYARFLPLPEGVIPGEVLITGMKSQPLIHPPVNGQVIERPIPPASPGPRKLDRIASSMAIVNNRPVPGYSVDSVAPPPPEPSSLNVHALFSRLLATGLLDQAEKVEPKLDDVKTAEEIVAKAEVDAINSVTLQIDSLRLRRQPIIDILYKGVQCNSCGLRFSADKTTQYSQHLDWHFRQNRREKAYGRKPQSRAWHYTTNDWMKFEEFGEEKGWFEGGEPSDSESASSTPEPELPTVPADSENPEMNQCAVCREEIPQFFDEELEEWRLRDAVREDAKTFHSSCYEDFKSHGETGLFPGLDVTAEEEPKAEQERLKADEEEQKVDEKKAEVKEEGAVKEELPEQPVIKEELKEEIQIEAKVEAADTEIIKAATPTLEEPIAAAPTPPTPIVDEIAIKEEPDRDIGTPVEDEKTVEVAPLVDIIDTSERIVSSLDGNLEVSDGATPLRVSKITFNISASSIKQKETEKVEPEPHQQWKHKEIEVNETPAELDELPPGEEPVVTLKPRMMGRKFKQMPVVAKGREESGLCTIM